jgi:probable F420-dependent oxidoreductase
MKFGIHLGNFGAAVSADHIVGLADAADRLGYESVWVSDHIVTPEVFSSQYPYVGTVFTADAAGVVFEPLVTLAFVAGRTRRIRVGTSVLVAPQRNALIMAKQIATLDALSGGRVEIGVGTGWMREEFEILGARFERRGAALDEYLAAWHCVWTEAKPEFHGEFVDLPMSRFGPLPAQPGGPPISIGGNGARSRRRAAEGGWGWHAFRLAPEEIRGNVAEFARLWEEAGRDRSEMRVLMRCHMDLDTPATDELPAWYLPGPAEHAAAIIDAYEAAGVTELILTPAPGKSSAEATEAMENFAAEFLVPETAAV